jgi:hypothetical protein
MACVTFWNERFDLGWAEPVLWGVALGVGIGRVADRRHWASDTFIGMMYGYYIGRTVARRSRDRAGRGGSRAMPLPGLSLSRVGSTTRIGWRGTF